MPGVVNVAGAGSIARAEGRREPTICLRAATAKLDAETEALKAKRARAQEEKSGERSGE
ncbi:hypothetical protein [Polyangium jinanense]|uniref:Uncharacterized protein n=1 Tax=Polyangium jinanense TaxID=2829994 RepID=A0A9X3X6C8_9BACT|nr:hypothetical protein [Polyangium jinanense]MDC3955798.1 hypothetical protein [Polyangium jinanense]MDC3983158.1 hypothetical protein [Polyangium jinanense]